MPRKDEYSYPRMMAQTQAAKGSELTETERATLLAQYKKIADAQAKLNAAEKQYTADAKAAQGNTSKIFEAAQKMLRVRGELKKAEADFHASLQTLRNPKGPIELIVGIIVLGWVFCLALVGPVHALFKVPIWSAFVIGSILYGALLLLIYAVRWQKKVRYETWLRSPQGMAWQQQEKESRARAEWELYHESRTTEQVQSVSGAQFKEFLARLFAKMGYTDISLTPANDQGGDILCVSPAGTRLVIQAKRWAGTVGNSAVQELLGAMLHYDRPEGMVVSNSTF